MLSEELTFIFLDRAKPFHLCQTFNIIRWERLRKRPKCISLPLWGPTTVTKMDLRDSRAVKSFFV